VAAGGGGWRAAKVAKAATATIYICRRGGDCDYLYMLSAGRRVGCSSSCRYAAIFSAVASLMSR